MDFLDRIGDWFTVFTGVIERVITGIFGSSNRRRIRKFGFDRDEKRATSKITPGSILDQINSQEADWEKLSDEELKETASKLRARLTAGETLDDFQINRVGPAIARVVKEVIVSDDGNITTAAALDVLRLATRHGAEGVTAIDPKP